MACIDTCKTECTTLNPNTLPPSGASCVQNCVAQIEFQLAAGLAQLAVFSAYGYAFSTVPNPGSVGIPGGRVSLNERISRISVWVGKTEKCCPALSKVLHAERNAVQAIRHSLQKVLPRTAAANISVIARGCEVFIIIESPIYVYCSSKCLGGN